MKEFSLNIELPEDLEYSQGSQAAATEWLVSLLRWVAFAIFAFYGPLAAPEIPVVKGPFYGFLLLGVVYNLGASYFLYSGEVRANPARFLSVFIFSDILILVALVYFSNLYQSGLFAFYLLLIVIVALRASLRLSLILGPIVILAYILTVYYVSDPAVFSPARMVFDSVALMTLTAFCGWFAEGKSKSWRALYRLTLRFKAVSKSLGETQRRLEIYHRLEEMRREFIAMVSHELRTPLTAILGYLDLILLGKAGPISDMHRGFLNSAVQESENLERLISNLIDMSLIQSGRWQLSLNKVHPGGLVEKVRDSYASQAEKEKIALNVLEWEETLPEIIADTAKIEKVLDNLLNNAIKFSSDGHGVELSVVEGDDSRLKEFYPHLISSTRVVTFTVRDQGPGISEEERTLIFESFHRIAEDVERELPRGGGLGLAIARELVELHWGKIWYEETPGGGSTFRFSLPVNPLRPRHRIALVKTEFRLDNILAGIVTQFEDEIARKKLHLVRKGWSLREGKGTIIYADRQLIQTLFSNIFNNNVRYASAGSELYVGVEQKRAGGDVRVVCRNSGEHIDWGVLEQIVSGGPEVEDITLRDARQINVSLHLARDIIETHGGSFSVKNLEYGGVEISMRFPAGGEAFKKGRV